MCMKSSGCVPKMSTFSVSKETGAKRTEKYVRSFQSVGCMTLYDVLYDGCMRCQCRQAPNEKLGAVT